MKLTRIKPSQPFGDDNLIPMINIVFLMLIFFMIAGHIEAADALKVAIPTSTSDIEQDMQSLEIIVSKDLQISVDDEILVLSSLTSTLNARFEQAENKDLFSLLIKVDGHLPVEKLQPVLSAIKQTGIKRVSLATQRLAEPA